MVAVTINNSGDNHREKGAVTSVRGVSSWSFGRVDQVNVVTCIGCHKYGLCNARGIISGDSGFADHGSVKMDLGGDSLSVGVTCSLGNEPLDLQQSWIGQIVLCGRPPAHRPVGFGLISAVWMGAFDAKSRPRGISGISTSVKKVEDRTIPSIRVRTEVCAINREGNEVGFRVVIITAAVEGKIAVTVIPIFLTLDSRELCG